MVGNDVLPQEAAMGESESDEELRESETVGAKSSRVDVLKSFETRTAVMKEFQIIGPAYPWSLGGSFWFHLISQNSCTWLSEEN